MSTEMINIIDLLVFAMVGGFSFMAGYLTRYVLNDDYDRGYQDGYDYGRKYQKVKDATDKL